MDTTDTPAHIAITGRMAVASGTTWRDFFASPWDYLAHWPEMADYRDDDLRAAVARLRKVAGTGIYT